MGSLNALLLQRLREARASERRALLTDHLVETAKSVLGPGSSLSPAPHQKFFEIGLKSIDFVELKDRLERDFEIELPVTLFFAYSTLGELTEHLLSDVLRLDGDRGSPHHGAAPASTGISTPGTKPLEGIEGLSDEEAERGLLGRIADLEKRLK